MTEISFKRITDARRYLAENGFSFDRYSPLRKNCEIYSDGNHTASLQKVAYRGYRVYIG